MEPTNVQTSEFAGYADVILDIPTRSLDQSFTYAIPSAIAKDIAVGVSVLVDFGKRPSVGYVVRIQESVPLDSDVSHIRPIRALLASSCFNDIQAQLALWIAEEYACPLSEAIHPFLPPGQKIKLKRSEGSGTWTLICEEKKPVDERWVTLIEAPSSEKNISPAAHVQRRVIEALSEGSIRMAELRALIPSATSAVHALEKKGLVAVEIRKKSYSSSNSTLSSALAPQPKKLTEGQVTALASIKEAMDAQRGDVVVVDGVTGSGKTEVYLEAIEEVRKRGQTAILLVPEISLTAQTVGRLRHRFGDDVAILHSKLSLSERFDQWDSVRRGETHVVVGARSALFACVSHLGLIIIDEEHEHTYKQELLPRYHAREVAAHYAQLAGCALVLGSATPSYESLARCDEMQYRGVEWKRVVMPERTGTAHLPHVSIVDMRKEFAFGNTNMFSRELERDIEEVIESHSKAIILINRRGFANFLMCRSCGAVPTCPHCSLTLTYHEFTHELKCHECDRVWSVLVYPNPLSRCSACGSRYMAAFGCGTQQVEAELLRRYGASAKIIRMDRDTTQHKSAHQKLLESFDQASCAILVGTQMIAKGLDFPEVTLVGVLNADTTLKMCNFRAQEDTYALLEQVGGRAGRGNVQGKVVIQTYWPDHPVMRALQTHDRAQLVKQDMYERKEAYYPPYARIANIIMWSSVRNDVDAYAVSLAQAIRYEISMREGKWQVLGPADCLKSKVNDRFRKHILIKAPLDAPVGSILSRVVRAHKAPPGMRITIDVDAIDIM